MTTEPTSGPTDAALISAAQSGDRRAYGELVARYQRAAVRIAAVALGSSTDAEDVAQEAFMRAHNALPRFDAGSRFEPWLFRIVTNTARNRHRQRGRQARLVTRAANRAPVAAIGPEEHAAHADDRRMLIEAINRLAPSDRLVLTYRWYHDLTESEMAEALGCRRGTVKSRLHRAMARLRDELGEIDGSGGHAIGPGGQR